MSTSDTRTAHDQSRFNADSLIVLGLGLLILALSLLQLLYRLSLPTDGWSYARDATGAGQRLIFDRNLSGAPSLLQHGDVLVALEGQPIEDMLARALTINPRRPANWTAGQTVQYIVLRDGHELTVDVMLVRLSASLIASNLGRTLLLNPSVLLTLPLALFVFLRRNRSQPARLLFLFSTCFFASDGISQSVSGSNIVGPAELFDRTAFWTAQFFNDLIWPFVIAPIYIHFFLIFPVLRKPMRRHRHLTLVALVGFMPGLALLALALSLGQPLVFGTFCPY